MLLGIKPTVDFVFKRVFGSPENIPVLIGLLNGILKQLQGGSLYALGYPGYVFVVAFGEHEAVLSFHE